MYRSVGVISADSGLSLIGYSTMYSTAAHFIVVYRMTSAGSVAAQLAVLPRPSVLLVEVDLHPSRPAALFSGEVPTLPYAMR